MPSRSRPSCHQQAQRRQRGGPGGIRGSVAGAACGSLTWSCRDLAAAPAGDLAEPAPEEQQRVVVGLPVQGQQLADEDGVVAAVVGAPQLALEVGQRRRRSAARR